MISFLCLSPVAGGGRKPDLQQLVCLEYSDQGEARSDPYPVAGLASGQVRPHFQALQEHQRSWFAWPVLMNPLGISEAQAEALEALQFLAERHSARRWPFNGGRAVHRQFEHLPCSEGLPRWAWQRVGASSDLVPV